MKNLRLADQIKINILLSQHHIRSRLTVEGKFPVAVWKRMYECQSRGNLLIQDQPLCLNPQFLNRPFQQAAKLILPDFPDKCGLSAKLVQHCQHVARRAAGTCLK